VIARPRRASPSSRSRPVWLACQAGPTPAMAIEDGTLSVKEKVDVLLRDDAKFEAAAVIPSKLAGSVGRRRTYPDYVWLMWPELRGVFGSHTAVERELGRGGWWRYIRRQLRRLRPDLPGLPAKPPRRQDYAYMRDRYLTTDDALERGGQIHTEVSIEQAKEAGNLDPDGRGSFTHPEVTRSFYGDGKVITPLYAAKPGATVTNRETDEVRALRFDPDAAFHTEGGGNKVWGTKYALVSTRRSEGRIIVGIEHVEKGRDEPTCLLVMLRRIRPHAPGAQAVVWDMIVRGTHMQTILNEIGLLPVVGIHAKSNPKGKKGRAEHNYQPKTADLEDKEVTMRDGTIQVVHIAAENGAASVKYLTETGEPSYEALTCRRIQRHEDKGPKPDDGSDAPGPRYRWYGQYQLPEEFAGQEITLRLHQNEEDDGRRLNRTENLRGIPEGSADFLRLRPLRPDAESINRGVEDTLHDNRASAKGWRGQMVDLLGHARLVNAITLARCRARQVVDPAA
jgi:hypothetical protein